MLSYRSLGIGVALVLGSWMSLSAALAENRVALVIGNSAYQSVPALPNPANDAKAMAEFLKSAGFEVVSAPDLTQSNMRRMIGDFADSLTGKGKDTVAIVFYAGHGLQVDGENYLVPIDANIVREADVPLQAVRLLDLMNALAAVPSKSRIVMLDACRNNPFSEINKVTGRGLAIVDAPGGTIVSYSTSPGSEALDGDGDNSPYTTALLQVAKEPGLPIEQAFKRVRFAVNDATRQQQLPWESSSLTSDFSFFPGEAGSRPRATPVSASAQGTDAKAATRSVDAWKKDLQKKPAREAYEIVIKDDTVEAYQAYLALYPLQPGGTRVREVLDRRRVMVAWYTAVTVNMPASYQTFLASYSNTDLGLTARHLLDRALSRSLTADPNQVANACPCSQPTPQPTQTKRASRPTGKKSAKTDDDPPAKRSVAPTQPQQAAPAPQAAPVPVLPIGIGIGIGGFGRGGGGGGGGYQKPSGPMTPSRSHPN
jgi:uncharacterized caspase-like protein